MSFLFPPRRRKHINNFDPSRFRDNPEKLFVFTEFFVLLPPPPTHSEFLCDSITVKSYETVKFTMHSVFIMSGSFGNKGSKDFLQFSDDFLCSSQK